MASYTVSAGNRAAHAKLLVASTADSVTFSEYVPSIEVDNLDGADRIYVTVDGVTATVAGATTYVLPAAICTRTIPIPAAKRNSPVVSVISAGAPTYSVGKRDPLEG